MAVISDDGERIVGEAEYILLPGGDGELAITVAPDWRGWLGPYLLDTLLEVAASRGVANPASRHSDGQPQDAGDGFPPPLVHGPRSRGLPRHPGGDQHRRGSAELAGEG